jgi:hypothetical protein
VLHQRGKAPRRVTNVRVTLEAALATFLLVTSVFAMTNDVAGDLGGLKSDLKPFDDKLNIHFLLRHR